MGVPVVKAAALATLPVATFKLMAISCFSGELARRTNGEIERVIETAVRRNLNKLLDRSLVDDQPASSVRPAGLRYGVAAIPAGESMTSDLQALMRSVLDAGGESIAYICNPLQALSLSLAAGTLDAPVLASPHVPPGMVLAVDPDSIATIVGAAAVEKSSETSLMLRDDPDADLMAGVQVQSMLQTDLVALRVNLTGASWGAVPGRVSWMESVGW